MTVPTFAFSSFLSALLTNNKLLATARVQSAEINFIITINCYLKKYSYKLSKFKKSNLTTLHERNSSKDDFTAGHIWSRQLAWLSLIGREFSRVQLWLGHEFWFRHRAPEVIRCRVTARVRQHFAMVRRFSLPEYFWLLTDKGPCDLLLQHFYFVIRFFSFAIFQWQVIFRWQVTSGVLESLR